LVVVIKVTRRVSGLVAATAIALIGVGAQAVPAAAPVNGALYGITFPATLATIDPASGGQTQVAQLGSIGPNPLVAALAADSRSSALVALVGTCTICPGPRGGGPVFFQLASVDTATGSIQASPVLQRPLAFSIAVDPATHQVWGVTNCFTCASQTVVRVDPSSGVETDVATLPVSSSFDVLVALAPRSDALYLAISVVGTYQLFTVSTTTGIVSAGPQLGQGITGMAVDTSNGALFVLRSGPSQTVERIDPETGSQTVLASFSGIGLSFATIDSRSHTLFAAGLVQIQTFHETEIVSVNDRNGEMTVGQPINAFVGPLAFHRTH
jgi:DNA-binding beta-propeller fold protein YncE